MFLIILSIEMDWVGKKKNLPFLRPFGYPLSKYLTFKIIFCMQWLFWAI